MTEKRISKLASMLGAIAVLLAGASNLPAEEHGGWNFDGVVSLLLGSSGLSAEVDFARAGDVSVHSGAAGHHSQQRNRTIVFPPGHPPVRALRPLPARPPVVRTPRPVSASRMAHSRNATGRQPRQGNRTIVFPPDHPPARASRPLPVRPPVVRTPRPVSAPRMAHSRNATANIRNLGKLRGSKTVNGSVGGGDREVTYRFELQDYSQFSLKLYNLTSDADVVLWREGVGHIKTSSRQGTLPEMMGRRLAPGVYFVRVMQKQSRTDYKLNLSAWAYDPFATTFGTPVRNKHCLQPRASTAAGARR